MSRPLLLGGFGPGLFAGVMWVQSLLTPGFHWPDHFGSELANGPQGWLLRTVFVVAGTATIAFAVGLRRIAPTAGWLLTGLFGVTQVVGGLFPMDPRPGYPPGGTGTAEQTLPGLIHDLNVFPSWIGMTGALIVFTVWFARRDEPGWAWSAALTAVLATTTLVVASRLIDQETGAGELHGVWARIGITVGYCWFGCLALHLLRRG